MGALERIEKELRRQHHSWTWLAQQLGISRQAVSSWKSRGVPREQFPAIAVALAQSIDWVAGLAERRGAAHAELSPMAQRLGQQFDTIDDPAERADAYAKCLEVIFQVKQAT